MIPGSPDDTLAQAQPFQPSATCLQARATLKDTLVCVGTNIIHGPSRPVWRLEWALSNASEPHAQCRLQSSRTPFEAQPMPNTGCGRDARRWRPCRHALHDQDPFETSTVAGISAGQAEKHKYYKPSVIVAGSCGHGR